MFAVLYISLGVQVDWNVSSCSYFVCTIADRGAGKEVLKISQILLIFHCPELVTPNFKVLRTNVLFISGFFHFSFSFLIFYSGAQTQGLHLEPLHHPLFVLGFFEIGSYELFAQASFKTPSS
jgi:hypothetical protein